MALHINLICTTEADFSNAQWVARAKTRTCNKCFDEAWKTDVYDRVKLARRALLKATVAAGGDGAGRAFVAAVEGLLCCPDSAVEGDAREAGMTDFDKALKLLWEYEVVSEDELRAWQADERAGRHYRVAAGDAQRLHEKGREFLEWVDAGEES